MFDGKRVLIVSPQPWGKMRISKHHYAIEFARLGAEVVYLNTFSSSSICQSKENIKIVGYHIPWHHRLKFHAYPIYRFLIKFLTPKVKETKEKWDLVISFDLGGDFPISIWKANQKIYFPADFPKSSLGIKSGEGADVTVSVAQTILDEFPPGLKLNIGHGLSDAFDPLLMSDCTDYENITNVGYAGNLLRPDLDLSILKKIISENTVIRFHVWGCYDVTHSHLGGNPSTEHLIVLKSILEQPNVITYGPVQVSELAEGFAQMDAFLICYNPQKDQSNSSNYHKILEFFSSGKVIISNRVREYESSNLLAMSKDYVSNADLPEIFSQVCSNPKQWNNSELCAQRKTLAKNANYKLKCKTLIQYIESASNHNG